MTLIKYTVIWLNQGCSLGDFFCNVSRRRDHHPTERCQVTGTAESGKSWRSQDFSGSDSSRIESGRVSRDCRDVEVGSQDGTTEFGYCPRLNYLAPLDPEI